MISSKSYLLPNLTSHKPITIFTEHSSNSIISDYTQIFQYCRTSAYDRKACMPFQRVGIFFLGVDCG
ncbi:hypothetical protein AQUCO_06800055v1 [Aquilegia coerulea]|uniref:Uncharacterized protein n=1 Tax=Aquilegia coerulea TaxID=218851 RepID=A0A2G5CBI7_AQUCA|nr:hypothetical protein AQUCO_06800055v1 [Aquilegia coerulea]